MSSFLLRRLLINPPYYRMFHTNNINKEGSILYSKTHETIQINNEEVKIGISDYARKELGEIVFIEAEVELEEEIEQGDSIVTIESVKASSELYSPSDGIVTEHNTELIENVNELSNFQEEDFWFVKYKTENIEELKSENMNKEEYLDFLKNE